MSLLLVRHGEAEHHIQEITGGWTDTDLTELGRRQVELLAERLRRELADVPLLLATSRLRRAIQTAEILSRNLAIDYEIHPALVDLNNGIAAGKTHAEARTLALQPVEPLLDWQPYPEAESWRQFYNRVAGYMQAYINGQSSTALLVTHAANIHGMVAWWLGVPVESRSHIAVGPASLTVLNLNRGQERTLERLNDCAHLYPAYLESRR